MSVESGVNESGYLNEAPTLNWDFRAFGKMNAATLFVLRESLNSPNGHFMTQKEHILWVWFLDRMVRDSFSTHKKTAREVKEWIAQSKINPKRYPISFPWLCETLELDAEKVEKALLSVREQSKYYTNIAAKLYAKKD